MLLSGPVVLQLVQRERNNDTGVEQPWPHALCLDLLSCVCYKTFPRKETISHMFVTNFIWTITLGILNQFQQSKWPLKAPKKTFQTVPKTSQGNQYSLSYQQISWQSPSHQILNH